MQMFNQLIAATLPLVPKPLVRRLSSRYIAGETVEDAVACVRNLNRGGMMATADILGEFVADAAEAEKASADYVHLLHALEGHDSNVSMKLSQLGLKLDLELCYQLTRRVLEAAADLGNFVRIDMEDTSCTTDTLKIFKRLRGDFENVGCVMQSYLRRSRADVEELVQLGANMRLCKGIYVEPPDLAFQDPEEVRDNYKALLRQMLEGGSYVGIATHDDVLVYDAMAVIRKLKLGPEAYEFQMLLGVTENLRQEILDAGHRLRVYVPYGEEWHAYSVRRLKENPKIAGYALKGILGR